MKYFPPLKFRFSLRVMIVVITAICILAALLIYSQPRDYSRYSAPDYALEMMDATEVTWELDVTNELGGLCKINYPPHPDHRYISIMSIKSKGGKLLGQVGGFGNSVVIIDGVTQPQKAIGFTGFYVPQAWVPKEDLANATIWAEIRIEDKYGNALFHTVKASETYREAVARAKQSAGQAGP